MLKFEEWLGLPNDEERGKRYEELSDKDKFKVRQGFYYFDNLIKEIDTSTPFMQEIKEAYEYCEKYKKEHDNK